MRIFISNFRPIPMTSPASSANLARARAKLDRFAGYDQGWDAGRGDAFDYETIANARQMLEIGANAGFSEADVFPSPTGEILVTFYAGDWDIDISIGRSLACSISLGKDGKTLSQYEGLSFATLTLALVKMHGILCSSEQSTPPTTTNTNAVGSKAPLSNRLAAAAYQSSSKNARWESRGTYALTSEPTTPQSRVRHQFIGPSQTRTVLPAQH